MYLICRNVIEFPGFVDTMYKNTPDELLLDNGLGTKISVRNDGFVSFSICWCFTTYKLLYLADLVARTLMFMLGCLPPYISKNLPACIMFSHVTTDQHITLLKLSPCWLSPILKFWLALQMDRCGALESTFDFEFLLQGFCLCWKRPGILHPNWPCYLSFYVLPYIVCCSSNWSSTHQRMLQRIFQLVPVELQPGESWTAKQYLNPV